jgi:hypothetical protein
MPLNDVLRLTMVSSIASGAVRMYNTFWFQQAVNDLTGDDRAVLANDFVGTMITPTANALRSVCALIVKFEEVREQVQVPYQESVFTLPIVGTPTGTKTGTALPPLCAVCITILSDRGGRSGRGRWYLPPTVAADVGDGLLFGSFPAQLATMMATFNNRYGLSGGYLVSGFRAGVWSKTLGGSPPLTSAVGFSPINGWVVRPEIRGINRRSRLND